jgi:hypothetical protein
VLETGRMGLGGWKWRERRNHVGTYIQDRGCIAFLCRIIESRNSSARSAPVFPSAGRDGWTRGCGHVDYREWENEEKERQWKR